MKGPLFPSLDKISDNHLLPAKIARKSNEGALLVIDRLLRENTTSDGQLSFSRELLESLRDQLNTYLHDGTKVANLAVMVPTSLVSLSAGLNFPDWDISLLGIGKHRFFLFHSALGLIPLRYLYIKWKENSQRPHGLQQWLQKVAGVALGTYAVGVGIHLAIDAFQPKAVTFPFFGSLVDGTLADDNVWLLGNSLWAFKIAYDVFALTFADNLQAAQKWTQVHAGVIKKWRFSFSD